MVQNKLSTQLFDCYENVQIRDYKDTLELEEILAGIYCHRDLKSLIQHVRDGSESKDDLPAFIPSLFNKKPTGIIQLDYDTIKEVDNSENLKRQLEKNVPSLSYAFISPSGGLKAGIMTDFYGDDVEPEKFKYAVRAVNNEVKRLISDPDIKFDPCSETINQPCFFSYDDNLVYNSNPKELPIREKAEKLFQEYQENQKNRTSSIRPLYVVSNDEIKSAFQAIPPDLEDKDRRNIINTAVLNVFGADGIDLIMDHWTQKNRKKTQEGINLLYQKTLKHQGTKVGIKTIIKEAKRHDWKNTTFKGRKTTGLEGNEPSYNCKLYPSVYEAVDRTQDVIGDYFNYGFDTLLHAECGLGKTEQTLLQIAEIDGTVAYFIPEHETANEIENKLISLGVPSDDIVIVSGYSRSCKRIQHLKDNEKVGLYQNWKTCLSCSYFNKGCVYHEQFKGNQRIRIYPHAYLFSPASSDKFKPDYVIVDESIAENICDITYYKRNTGRLFKRLIDGETITSDEIDTEISRLNKLFRSSKKNPHLIPPPAFKFNSKKWMEDLKKNRRTSSAHTKIKHLEELQKKINGKYTDYMIWTRSSRAYFGKKKQIDPRWHSKPILHLDASGDKNITEIVFEKDFDVYEKIRCKYARGVRVIQVFNKLFSKGQCAEDTTREGLEWLVSMIKSCSNKIGFVGYKNITLNLNDNDKKTITIPFMSKLIPEQDHHKLLTYGGLRGKNKVEDAGCHSLVQIGTHMLPNADLVDNARVLFRTDNFVKETATVKKTYRMADGNHLSAVFVDYVDERLQALSEVMDKAESYQAGHRGRLLHEPNRTLLLLTNEVLDFTVDELISVEQVIPRSDKRRRLIQAVIENDGQIPVKKNVIIMEKTGLDEDQVKSMKNGKENKEWIQNNFWFHVNGNEMLELNPFYDRAGTNGDIGHILEEI
jgi:VirE-like protein